MAEPGIESGTLCQKGNKATMNQYVFIFNLIVQFSYNDVAF